MPEPLTPHVQSPNEPAQQNFPLAAVGVAGAVIALAVAILVILSTRHHSLDPNQQQPLAPSAGSLVLSQLAMSESISLSGGKSTFLDGHITNRGTQIVSAVTVQVFFRNDEGMPPHLETLPVMLVRTHEPYVDTQPISADPLQPGDDREFRLIFESIPSNWNTQLPDVHVVAMTPR